MAALSPLSLTSFYDPYDGSVLQAKVFFYKASTLDPVTVYTDAGLAIPHAQPVLSGGSGRVPPVWIGFTDSYRVRTFDQYDVLLEDIDNIPGMPEEDEGGGGGGPGDGSLPPTGSDLDLLLKKSLLKTGDMWAAFTNSLQLGDRAVRANGLTIGSAASSATERANADCEALFKFLWGQDGNQLLAILPSRGPSADGDWLANKQLTLPDMRGMVAVGIDQMGNPASSGRFTGGLRHGGEINSPGATGGLASHTLTEAQLASHNHYVNDPTHGHVIHDPGHDHGVGDPWHAHGVNDPGHIHTLSAAFYVAGTAGSSNWQVTQAGAQVKGARESDRAYIGVGINGAATGIDVWGAGTGIWNGYSATGIWLNATGGNASHNNMQPWIALTWYIHL